MPHENEVVPPPEQLLWSMEDVSRVTGLGEATLYRYRSAGKLPRPITLTRGAVRWRAADIRLWVEWGCPSLKEFEARKAAMR
jgi:predicted DNA-binding transcriptional regulator AlpA